MSTDRIAANHTKLWNADFVLLSISAVVFYTSFYFLLSTLPEYVRDIGGDRVAIGIVMGAFALSSLVLRPFIGRLLDRGGRKWMVILGTILFVLSPALYWYAGTLPLIVVVRVLHGAGMALFTTAATTMVADVAPAARRGEAMGIFGVTANIALAAGPPIGAAVLLGGGFGNLFAVSAVVALFSVILALPVRDRVQVPSQTQTVHRGIHTYLSREVALPSVAILAVMLTYGPLITFLPDIVGPTRSGMFFTVYAIAVSAARALAGRLSDRYGRPIVISPGLLFLAVAMFVLAFTQSLAGLIAVAILYGVGMASAQPALYALTVDMVDISRRGIAMGTFMAAFELGIGAGAIFGGLVAERFGYAIMFSSAGMAGVLGLIIFLIRSYRRDFTPAG